MKKGLFMCILFFASPAFALTAPELYMVDSSCPKNTPFRQARWEHYKDREEGYHAPYGNCISCETTKALMMLNPKDCDMCPNRTVDGVDTIPGIISSNYCRLKTCPSDKPFYDVNWNLSGCKSCQDEPKHIKKEECNQCSNMRWIEGAGCAPDKTNIMYYNGAHLDPDGYISHLVGGSKPYDIDCDSVHWQRCEAVQTSEEECKKCSFTYMKDGFCHMEGWKKVKDCPEGHIRNICGFCVPCDNVNGDRLSKGECEKCPYHNFNNGFCNRNTPSYSTRLLLGYEDLGNGRIIERSYTCDDERSISTTKEYCDVCPNRVYLVGECMLREIACENDLLQYQPDIGQEECLKCSNLIFKDGQCLYKISANPDYRLVYMDEDSDYGWIRTDCDEPDKVKTTKEYCDACSNRVWTKVDEKFGECSLKDYN